MEGGAHHESYPLRRTASHQGRLPRAGIALAPALRDADAQHLSSCCRSCIRALLAAGRRVRRRRVFGFAMGAQNWRADGRLR